MSRELRNLFYVYLFENPSSVKINFQKWLKNECKTNIFFGVKNFQPKNLIETSINCWIWSRILWKLLLKKNNNETVSKISQPVSYSSWAGALTWKKNYHTIPLSFSKSPPCNLHPWKKKYIVAAMMKPPSGARNH